MKIENFNIISDQDIYQNIPNKELNALVKAFITQNSFQNFNEKITFKLKDANIGFINSIRHACYKTDEVYYLDADFNDIKLITEDNIYIQKTYLLNRLKSIPIKQDPILKQYVDTNIGKLQFNNNRTSQYSNVTTEHLIFNIKDNIIINKFCLYQLIYSKATLLIDNIHLKVGRNQDNCMFSSVHTFSINTPDTNESSSNIEFSEFDIMIATNGTINFFVFINKIIDNIITKFEKKYVALKDDNDNLLSLLYENEDYIFENLILEYSYKNKFSPIISIKDNNLYIKNISENNLETVFKHILNEFNDFKTLINTFNK